MRPCLSPLSPQKEKEVDSILGLSSCKNRVALMKMGRSLGRTGWGNISAALNTLIRVTSKVSLLKRQLSKDLKERKSPCILKEAKLKD
jgi:hypothetical protein